MNEEQFRRELRRQAEAEGLIFMTTHPWKSTAGAPDVAFFGPGGLIIAELKSENGRRSRAQIAVGHLFGAGMPAEYRLFRPVNWEDGFIDNNLRWAARRR